LLPKPEWILINGWNQQEDVIGKICDAYFQINAIIFFLAMQLYVLLTHFSNKM
jgi:hypothetical protein